MSVLLLATLGRYSRYGVALLCGFFKKQLHYSFVGGLGTRIYAADIEK